MISTESTEVTVTTQVFTAATPDTSNITATVEGDLVTIVYGGTSLVLPTNALPVLTAITATIGASIPPIVTPEAPVEDTTTATDAPAQ